MKDIGQRVIAARGNARETERIIEEYLPFIRKQAASVQGAPQDDSGTLALLGFVQAMQKYEPGKGAFLAYAQLVIRSRLLDEIRKAPPAHLPLEAEDGPSPIDEASIARYDADEERRELAAEIAEANAALEAYGISFALLGKIGPRQQRSRALCLRVARHIACDDALCGDFNRTGRLPQAAAALALGISPKTIEKHRRYIVALLVLLAGDFPHIHCFLREEAEA